MKKTILILTILLFLNTPSRAFEEWTTTDTKLQLTYSVLYILDWGQTRYIAKHPETYYEKNIFFGRHPSVGQVDTYFFNTLWLHAGISYLLSQPYRKYWQCIWIIREAHAVGNNYMMGIKIEF
jgi:hypothetical protein